MNAIAHCRRWYRSVLLALLFAAGILSFAVALPAVRCLGQARARRARDFIQTAWCRTAARILGLRVACHGEPPVDGIMAANHISWLDVVVLGTCRPLTFLAKSEVAAWPVVGYLARQTGTLFVRRGDAAANRLLAEQMCRRIHLQETLVLFPEGTTSRGDRLLKFHARLFQPALALKQAVQPVAIAYAGTAAAKVPFVDDDEFLPHLWALLAEPEISAVLHFGRPINHAATRDELAETAWRAIAARLGFDPAVPAPRRTDAPPSASLQRGPAAVHMGAVVGLLADDAAPGGGIDG